MKLVMEGKLSVGEMAAAFSLTIENLAKDALMVK